MRKSQKERQEYKRCCECIDRWLEFDVSLFNKRISQAQLEKAKKCEKQRQLKKAAA